MRFDNTDGIVLKEIPVTILCKRKYAFFLKGKLKQKIPFRWDKLGRIIFTFKHQRFRLNSLQKARSFFEKI